MRGYLSRTGVGLLMGVLVAAGMLPLARRADRLPDDARMVGPFRVAVERFQIRNDDQGRPTAYVQMHLWRPDGPVSLPNRVRVDGVGYLGGAWELRHTDWLLKNEFMTVPAGDSYEHPVLGAVPATHNAGEARAVFEFEWACPRSDPGAESDFVFQLPDGELVAFADLHADVR